MADESQKRTPIGKKPPTPNLAWHYLTREAKTLLLQERLRGRFGGTPGKAPYWMIQEEGNAGASVEPLFYIKKAVLRWQSSADVKVNRFFRGK